MSSLDVEFFSFMRGRACSLKGVGHLVKDGCLRLISKGLMEYARLSKPLALKPEKRGLCVYDGRLKASLVPLLLHMCGKAVKESFPSIELSREQLERFFDKEVMPLPSHVSGIELGRKAYVFITYESYVYALAELEGNTLRRVK